MGKLSNEKNEKKRKEENKGRRDDEQGRKGNKGRKTGETSEGWKSLLYNYKDQILDPQNLRKSQVGVVITLLIPDSTESISRANLVVRLALYVTSGLSWVPYLND